MNKIGQNKTKTRQKRKKPFFQFQVAQYASDQTIWNTSKAKSTELSRVDQSPVTKKYLFTKNSGNQIELKVL